MKTEDEDEDIDLETSDGLGLKEGGCSSVNSLVPSSDLVNSPILHSLPTSDVTSVSLAEQGSPPPSKIKLRAF